MLRNTWRMTQRALSGLAQSATGTCAGIYDAPLSPFGTEKKDEAQPGRWRT
jgi:hypothetical protein